MQAVDVLREQREQLAASLQRHERRVARVGLGIPRFMRQTLLPGAAAHLGIAHVVLESRELLRRWILRPHTLRATKIRDARLGRDSGVREYGDAARTSNQRRDGRNLHCEFAHERPLEASSVASRIKRRFTRSLIVDNTVSARIVKPYFSFSAA